MKRLFCILALLLALCCVFVACDEPACQHLDANDDALCDTCGEAYTDGTESPEHTHAFGEWSITTPATCTEKGVETRTCACGESETRELGISHTWGEWSVVTPATCSTEGTKTRTCTCGESETREITATGAHTFTEKSMTAEYVQTAPTCESVGTYFYKCAYCSAKGTETYTVGPHSFTAKVQTVPFFKSAANCESPALYYYKCEWCNAKGEETYPVGSEQHDFTAKVQTSTYLKSAANCQGPAEYYYKCSLCDDHGTSTYKVGAKTTHVMDENHICTTCSNAYIYFGEYPQTIKADNVTITATTDSRGYYLGNDNAYYAKVTADPYSSGYTFSDGSTVTDGTVYYFKVEPILWRILSQSDDTALILCDSIIANKAFDAGSGSNNNYAESDIRAWLNAEFYNTAFTALEQELILTTTVDNSAASTGYDTNPYACANTNDKVFLLSYAEVTNSAYGFASSDITNDTPRRMQTSDYSRATGAYTNTSTDYYGNGYWWLRSPSNNFSFQARYVGYGGVGGYSVGAADDGVVPALQIRLS